MNVLAIFIGLFSGGLGGFFGISGAFLIITCLTLFKMVPNQRVAAGTTLLTILPPVTILAVYIYYKNKEIDYDLAFTMMVFYFIGGGLGALLANKLDDKTLKLMVSTLFFILGIVSLITYSRTKKSVKNNLSFGQRLSGLHPIL